MVNKIFIKWVLRFILVSPFIFLFLEIGIRIAAPQPLADIDYDDIYTVRYSNAMNRMVKALVPGMTRMLNGAVVHINNDGMRDYDYPESKKQGIKRIAIVGSSVAFGFKLELEDTFAESAKKLKYLKNPRMLRLLTILIDRKYFRRLLSLDLVMACDT